MTEKRPRGAGKSTFESELERLEEIVRALESGDVPLADLLTRYEAGMKHLKACREFLSDAELRLEQIRTGSSGATPIEVARQSGE